MNMDIKKILATLPHRFPIILVDRVLELESGKRIVTLKNVSANEPVFTGHFPEFPVLPGVYILEAMAQSAAILAIHTSGFGGGGNSGIYYFAGIDKARFKRPVLPDEDLEVDVHSRAMSPTAAAVSAVVRVGDAEAAQVEILVISTPRAGLEQALAAIRGSSTA